MTMRSMRYYLEVVLPNYEPDIERLELSDNFDAARAAYALARSTWNDGERVVVRVGEVDPLVLRTFIADDVAEIRLVDTWEHAA